MYTVGAFIFNTKTLGVIIAYNEDRCLTIIGYDKTFLAEQVKLNWGDMDFSEMEGILRLIQHLDIELQSDWNGVVFTDQFAYSLYENIRKQPSEMRASYELLSQAKRNRSVLPMFILIVFSKMAILCRVGEECAVSVLRSQEHVEEALEEITSLPYIEATAIIVAKTLRNLHPQLPESIFESPEEVYGELAEVVITLMISAVVVPHEAQLANYANAPWRHNYRNN